jgi:pimeloyl-[acyl-carrier protein] methyl ester esterase
MSLYIESHGQGPDLVLLHGWGLHGGIFASIVPQLSKRFRLHLVDLPGHGRSAPHPSLADIHHLAAYLAEHLPAKASWLGWSLGGRVALAAAAQQIPMHALILIGSTPCFCQREDWPHGMPAAELEQFRSALAQDYRATLQRFLAVQSRGSAQGREELRLLRESLFTHGEPHPDALEMGLALLRDVDLRPHLADIHIPTLVLHGQRDTLAPLAAAEYLANTLPQASLQVIEGAGHAPFISHPDEFLQALLHWHQQQSQKP